MNENQKARRDEALSSCAKQAIALYKGILASPELYQMSKYDLDYIAEWLSVAESPETTKEDLSDLGRRYPSVSFRTNWGIIRVEPDVEQHVMSPNKKQCEINHWLYNNQELREGLTEDQEIKCVVVFNCNINCSTVLVKNPEESHEYMRVFGEAVKLQDLFRNLTGAMYVFETAQERVEAEELRQFRELQKKKEKFYEDLRASTDKQLSTIMELMRRGTNRVVATYDLPKEFVDSINETFANVSNDIAEKNYSKDYSYKTKAFKDKSLTVLMVFSNEKLNAVMLTCHRKGE